MKNILSLEALQRNLLYGSRKFKTSQRKADKTKFIPPNQIKKLKDMVMIKTHADGQFQPIYKGYYRIVSFKGNQVQVIPCEGGKTTLCTYYRCENMYTQLII